MIQLTIRKGQDDWELDIDLGEQGYTESFPFRWMAIWAARRRVKSMADAYQEATALVIRDAGGLVIERHVYAGPYEGLPQ